MTTQILNLPLLEFAVTVRNNEDWVDAWSYLDASGAPISLAGLELDMMVRTRPDDPVIRLAASNVPGLYASPIPAGAITTGGDGGNILGLSIGQGLISQVGAGSYVFEVRARGDGHARDIATGELTVEQGIVR